MVEPRAPRAALKILNLAFWVAMMLTSVAFGLALGLNVLLVPVWIVMGGSVGVTARRAWSWTCPECHEEMRAPRDVTTHAPLVPQHV